MKARFNTHDYIGAKPKYNACLLYGSDSDLVDERCAELTRTIAGPSDDPFRVVTLSLVDHARLPMEVAAGSLTGGQRVVRVRDCGERLLSTLAQLDMSSSTATLILLSSTLTSKSKLRVWAQQTAWIGTVACDAADPMHRQAFVQGLLTQAGLTAGRDAQDLLAERLPVGRRAISAELEKLFLLSTSGVVQWDDARELIETSSPSTMFAAIDLALAGDGPAALVAWEQAIQAGGTGVSLVRIAGTELGRLAALRTQRELGVPLQSALEGQRIYPRDPRYQQWSKFVERWTSFKIASALQMTLEAESACKRTGSNERLLVAKFLELLAAAGR